MTVPGTAPTGARPPDGRPGTDVRLVPAALAAWATAAALTSGVGPAVGLVVAAVAVGAVMLLATPTLLVRRTRGARPAPWARRGRHASGRNARDSALATAAVAGLAVAAVALAAACQLHVREQGVPAAEQEVTVVGEVRGDPRPAGGGRHLVRLRTYVGGDVPPGRTVLLRGGGAWLDVQHGTRVASSGTLVPLPRTDAEVAEVEVGPPEVVRQPSGSAAVVGTLRQGLVDRVSVLPVETYGLVAGTALGDTRGVPADVRQALRDTSLAHITAVSGAHFSVVLGAVLGLAGGLRLARPWRVALAAPAMVGFVLLVHPGPSVLRAAVMGAVVLVGIVLGRPSRAVPALCVAVVGLVCLDPWSSRSLGFQLSVAATAAIVLVAPPLAARLPVPRPVGAAIAVPTAAQAACGPLLVLIDPMVPLYSVPVNAVTVPALLPATLGGILGTLLVPVLPVLADVPLLVAAVAVRWMAAVAVLGAGLPGARLPWPGGAGGAWLLAVLTVATFAAVLRRPAVVR